MQLKAYEALLARVTRADARIEALMNFLGELASAQGIDRKSVIEKLKLYERQQLQKMLERAEDTDPKCAANLDSLLRSDEDFHNPDHS